MNKENKKQNKIIAIVLAAILVIMASLLLYNPNESEEKVIESSEEVLSENLQDHEEESDYIYDESEVIDITLQNSTATSEDDKVEIADSVITISNAGNYRFSGTLDDGQIIVDSKEKDVVRLILSDAQISNSTSCPIYITNSEKTIIILEDGTSNYLSDASSYEFASDEESEENEPNAAIFSKDNLTIYTPNNGQLAVEGNYNDAITSKDGLIFRNAIVQVKSADDGIRGKNYLINRDGQLTVNSVGDGLKSDNTEDASQGYIEIAGGKIDITTTQGDAISGETDVIVKSGDINIVASGDGATQDSSCKGIKATQNIIIDEGNININSYDDALHSNNALTINNGNFKISSEDDAIHADSDLIINDGDITVEKCYEGIESAKITINNGVININSSDDGLNVAGGVDSSGGQPMGGRGQADGFNSNSDYYLHINNGTIYVNAVGDGVDVNGSVEMTDGTLIVDGPTSNGNGALDYDGTFNISGGLLVAAGSSGMAQAPSTTSEQYSILINFSAQQSASQLVNISNDSQNIITYSPSKKYQSIVVSSPQIQNGATYTVNLGGSSTGENTNGLHENGTYTPGTEYTQITIESITTKSGDSSNSMPGGNRMDPNMDSSMDSNNTRRAR